MSAEVVHYLQEHSFTHQKKADSCDKMKLETTNREISIQFIYLC